MKSFLKSLISPTFPKIKSIRLDIVSIVLILILLKVTIITFQDNPLSHKVLRSIISYLWLSSPVILLYLLLRIIRIPLLLCTYITLSLILALYFINHTKVALTGEPLSFNDLISGVNLTVASRYLTFWPIAIGSIVILSGAIFTYISRKSLSIKENRLPVFILFFLTAPFAFSPYFTPGQDNNNVFNEKMYSLSHKFSVLYYSWDWPGNVRTHGLPMHLVQTSVRNPVPVATDTERKLYKKETKTSLNHNLKTIIYILCESCWYDENHFVDIFKPLFDSGYKPLRAISPVYGAGTANSEFEMLTGLPSNSKVLSGIIYQEYADLIKVRADTLASALNNKGFITFAAHNNDKKFWKRDVIYKKFGFDDFKGFSDMGSLPKEYTEKKKPWQWQADDYLLYRTALDAIKNAGGNKIFLSLITMSTHGPFQHINDYGEGVYSYELNESIERITEFSKEVEKLDPNALIVIYGDHKPSLNRFFTENNVLSKELFSRTGKNDEDFIFKSDVTPEDFGDVPVLIKSKDNKSMMALIDEANHSPFFCLSTLIDKHFINSGLAAFNYNKSNVCGKNTQLSYEEAIATPPAWIYSLALFKD